MPARRASPLILIVTEGEETEPQYFEALKVQWRLTGIKVKRASASAPIHVVETAIRLREEAAKASRGSAFQAPYDEVWAVMDQDEHTTLRGALTLARQKSVKVAISKPCFELWLLLHFIPSLKPLTTSDQVQAELVRHLSGYSKSMKMDELVQLAEKAIANAETVENRLKDPGMSNYPSTTVHHLIRALAALRREP
jgi:hypothetical protein